MEYNQPPKLQCSKSYLRKKEQGRDLKKQHSNLVMYEKKKMKKKKKKKDLISRIDRSPPKHLAFHFPSKTPH